MQSIITTISITIIRRRVVFTQSYLIEELTEMGIKDPYLVDL